MSYMHNCLKRVQVRESGHLQCGIRVSLSGKMPNMHVDTFEVCI
jgi:hypothetical protein